MADILLDNQAQPTAPASAKSLLYVDTTSKELVQAEGTSGLFRTVRPLTNANTADVVANAANTYLTGSSLTIPPALVRAGSTLTWRVAMSKSAAGTATGATIAIVVGTNGTTADTARVTFTFGTQTAVTDTGYMDIQAIVRTNGATGQVEASALFEHTLAATGLDSTQFKIFQSTPATFDMTVANSIWGLTCNPGAAGVWTFQHISVMGVAL